MSASRAAPASEDSAAVIDWVGDAGDLLQFLRDRGLQIGTGEVLRITGLLQRLREQMPDDTPLSPESAALWLAPLLCSTAAEQAALGPLLTAYARTRRVEPRPGPGHDPPLPIVRGWLERVVAWIARHRITAISAMVLILGLGLLPSFLEGHRQQLTSYVPNLNQFIPIQARSSLLAQIPIAFQAAAASLDWMRFAVLPPLLWLWFLRRRQHRRPALNRIQVPENQSRQQVLVGGTRAALFQDTDLSQPLQAMRAHRLVQGTQLDPRGSIRATIAAGGCPSLVTLRRPRLPDYPIVVSERSREDHLAALARALIARLREERVELTIYAFSESLDHLRAPGGRVSVAMEELPARHGGDILLLIDDGGTLWDPLTGALRRQASDMVGAWEQVILLTPVPQRRWSWRECQLAEAGMIVLPATGEGLALMGDFLRGGQEPPRPALRHRPVRGALAELGDPDSALGWLRDSPMPPEIDRREMLDAIAREMPKQAFDIACVLALFPEVRIDLTMHAIKTLPDRGAAPLSLEEVFGAFAALPWFRYGRMPDWLRLELALCLDHEQRHEAARFYAAYLGSDASSNAGSLDLSVEPAGLFAELRRRLSRREAPVQLRDTIFLRFSRGEALDQLDLEVPENFARLIRPGWRSLERLGHVLIKRFPICRDCDSNSMEVFDDDSALRDFRF